MSVRIVGKYQVLQEVGSSSNVAVYLARDPRTKQIVRIRLLNLAPYPINDHAHLIDRFWRSVESIQKMVHPHIARIVDSGEYQDSPFVVFETVQGTSFAEIQKPIPVDVAARLLRPVAGALDFLSVHGFTIPNLRLNDLVFSTAEHVMLSEIPVEEWLDSMELGNSETNQATYRQLSILFYELITGISPKINANVRAKLPIRNLRKLVSALPEREAEFFRNAFAPGNLMKPGGEEFISRVEDLILKERSDRKAAAETCSNEVTVPVAESDVVMSDAEACEDALPQASDHDIERAKPVSKDDTDRSESELESDEERATPDPTREESASELPDESAESQPAVDTEESGCESLTQTETSENQIITASEISECSTEREAKEDSVQPSCDTKVEYVQPVPDIATIQNHANHASEPILVRLSDRPVSGDIRMVPKRWTDEKTQSTASSISEVKPSQRTRTVGLSVLIFAMGIAAGFLLIRFGFPTWQLKGVSLPGKIQAIPSMALGSICEGLVQEALMTAAAGGSGSTIGNDDEGSNFAAVTTAPRQSLPAAALIPTSSATSTLMPTVTFTPTMTVTPTVTPTITQTMTATPDLPLANELILSVMTSDSKEDYAYVKGRIRLVDENVQFAASGLEGELKHANNGYIEEFSTDAMNAVKNFILEVEFLNPYDASFHDFDFGIIFRDEGNKNNQYRISMDSDGVWAFQDNRNQKTGILVDSGYLPTFNRLKDEVNSVLLIVQDNRGLFYFNQAFVKEFNLEDREIVGKVAIGTGFFNGDEADGYSTGYRNLYVRDLGDIEVEIFDPLPCEPWERIDIIRAYGNPLSSVKKSNGIAEMAITGGMIVLEPPLSAQAYDWEAVVEPDHFNKKPVRRECEWIGARIHCGPFRWIRPAGGTPYIFKIYRKDSKCLVSEVTMDNVYFGQVWNLLRY